jgi:hypothetical protein
MAGHYANFANISHSDYEFTITFARVDHEVESGEIPGVVVSRINLSPRFARELITALEDNYSRWTAREGIKNLPEFKGEAGRRARSSAQPPRPCRRPRRRSARLPEDASRAAVSASAADRDRRGWSA